MVALGMSFPGSRSSSTDQDLGLLRQSEYAAPKGNMREGNVGDVAAYQSTEKSTKLGGKIRLPASFEPSKYTVLCGRGSKCTKSSGNTHLKMLVQSHLDGYSQAKNKIEKTSIVSSIIGTVKDLSPEGGFVKFENGAWWEVEDAFAREKIGCLFRDALHMLYRSSTKAKQDRKRRASLLAGGGKSEELSMSQSSYHTHDGTVGHGGPRSLRNSSRALNSTNTLFRDSQRAGLLPALPSSSFVLDSFPSTGPIYLGAHPPSLNESVGGLPSSHFAGSTNTLLPGISFSEHQSTSYQNAMALGDIPDDISDIFGEEDDDYQKEMGV